ncbi:hypothetical protein HDF26_000459 [Pedobacter cryoconitis]|uniref:hypothetical protein n=1 Tax=Pedobacter cryoconitis TaxID=188932 RepID=UPI001611EBAE|nr:hypothetical protein [Pedobacter cryoconitis]MBB6270032.1 hypothetical protein [Pedobacter cryoconitis]
MFEEYKIELLDFYRQRKIGNQLSDNLENVQRWKLRNECLRIFAEKNTNKDQEIIKAFFDPSGEFNDPVRSIEKVGLDKFRPLISFLLEGKNIRDDASVKLLAWLMDFDSYQEWKSKKGIAIIVPSIVEPPVVEPPVVEPPSAELPTVNSPVIVDPGTVVNPPVNAPVDISEVRNPLQKILDKIIERPLSIKITTIICITFLGVGGFFSMGITTDTIRQPLADEKCMYWTGSHYEPVKCDEKIKNVTIIPINLRTLNSLKKIDLTDTLTRYSLGKVWYSKIDGKREFFTDSGAHPMNPYKKLRPLSKYILSNYISYYRYLLTYLKWTVCVIVFVVLLMVCIIYLLREQKKKRHSLN